MDQRVSMIMTAATDIPKQRAFYEKGLGWTPWMPPAEQAVMYKVGHSVLVFREFPNSRPRGLQFPPQHRRCPRLQSL